MTPLQKQKLKQSLKVVQAAIEESITQRMECEERITTIEVTLALQKKRESELTQQLESEGN